MNTSPITVTDGKGGKKPALLVTCPECGEDLFNILVIDGHNHLQCSECNTSFCQGGCEHKENNEPANFYDGRSLPVTNDPDDDLETDSACPNCGSGFPSDEKGNCKKCGL